VILTTRQPRRNAHKLINAQQLTPKQNDLVKKNTPEYSPVTPKTSVVFLKILNIV